MEEINREAHVELEDQDWIDYGYPPKSASISDLSNPIHPIFSHERSNPPPGHGLSDKKKWHVAKREHALLVSEYEYLEPTLLLASRLILSPASVELLHSIMYGRRRLTGIVRNNLPVFQFSRSGLPYSQTRDQVQDALVKLGEYTNFMFVESKQTDIAGGSNAVTKNALPFYPQGINILSDPRAFGLPSVTFIDIAYKTGIEASTRPARNDKSPAMIQKGLNISFRMATTLCHEITHAIFFACNPELLRRFMAAKQETRDQTNWNEPFFETQKVAELGFCWENHVFGGFIGQGSDYANDALFVTEWPSHLNSDPAMMPIRGEDDTGEDDTNPHSFLVSTHYIQNIQTDDFWDLVMTPGYSEFALHIKQAVGMNNPKGTEPEDEEPEDEEPDIVATESAAHATRKSSRSKDPKSKAPKVPKSRGQTSKMSKAKASKAKASEAQGSKGQATKRKSPNNEGNESEPAEGTKRKRVTSDRVFPDSIAARANETRDARIERYTAENDALQGLV